MSQMSHKKCLSTSVVKLASGGSVITGANCFIFTPGFASGFSCKKKNKKLYLEVSGFVDCEPATVFKYTIYNKHISAYF